MHVLLQKFKVKFVYKGYRVMVTKAKMRFLLVWKAIILVNVFDVRLIYCWRDQNYLVVLYSHVTLYQWYNLKKLKKEKKTKQNKNLMSFKIESRNGPEICEISRKRRWRLCGKTCGKGKFCLYMYTEWSRKIAQSLMHRHFSTVCSRITEFSPKCLELTGNTKNGQILSIVIKYSFLAAGKGST